jgi:hypothetical protein
MPKLDATEVLEMIVTGHYGTPDSLLNDKRCREWPQVRPAIREVLDELYRLREQAKVKETES